MRAGKRFSLFISNEDTNDIIKVIQTVEDANVLIDGITETGKHEIKGRKRCFSWSLGSTFSRFIGATSDFFNSKRYKWKKS